VMSVTVKLSDNQLEYLYQKYKYLSPRCSLTKSGSRNGIWKQLAEAYKLKYGGTILLPALRSQIESYIRQKDLQDPKPSRTANSHRSRDHSSDGSMDDAHYQRLPHGVIDMGMLVQHVQRIVPLCITPSNKMNRRDYAHSPRRAYSLSPRKDRHPLIYSPQSPRRHRFTFSPSPEKRYFSPSPQKHRSSPRRHPRSPSSPSKFPSRSTATEINLISPTPSPVKRPVKTEAPVKSEPFVAVKQEKVDISLNFKNKIGEAILLDSPEKQEKRVCTDLAKFDSHR